MTLEIEAGEFHLALLSGLWIYEFAHELRHSHSIYLYLFL